jgi:hypothetical protein
MPLVCGQLRLQSLRYAEGGEPLVAGHLGVGGIAVAILGTVQGVVEDPYKVVVLVPAVRSP